MRILVVEDDDRLVQLLQRGLGEEGHAVDACTTCADALPQAQTIAYDVILLDWMLPDGDGLSLLRSWRDREVEDADQMRRGFACRHNLGLGAARLGEWFARSPLVSTAIGYWL